MNHPQRNCWTRHRLLSFTLSAALALGLGGCHGIHLGNSSSGSSGGGGGSTINTDNFPEASTVIGQGSFTSKGKNGGSGQTNANGLEQPFGSPVLSSSGIFLLPDTGNDRVLGFHNVPPNNYASATFILGQSSAAAANTGASKLAFNQPSAVAVANNHFFVADTDNSRVLIYDEVPSQGRTPADVVVGQKDFTSSGKGHTQSTLKQPSAVAVDNGDLIVADSGNNRVLIYDGIPDNNNAKAKFVIGQPNFTDNSSGTSATQLNDPTSVAVDGDKLIIADTANNRVLIYDSLPGKNGAEADAVVGQTDFEAGGSAATKDGLDHPFGVFVSGGQLFVADKNNNRVLIYDSVPSDSSDNGASADRVIGQNDFTHNAANDDDQDGESDSTPTARTLDSPTDVYVDNDDRLYVTDSGNNRVLIYNF